LLKDDDKRGKSNKKVTIDKDAISVKENGKKGKGKAEDTKGSKGGKGGKDVL
jgi:hypothetical protein